MLAFILYFLVSVVGIFIGVFLYEATIGKRRDKKRGFKDQDTLR